MAGNVGCSESGCDNPVIGQCIGYRGTCGQFYCHAHSKEKLCSECGRRKSHDEQAEKTYQDYLQTARRTEDQDPRFGVAAGFWSIFVICAAPISYITIMNGFEINNTIKGVGLLATVLLVIVYLIRRKYAKDQEFAKIIDAIEQTKPGFSEFYSAYRTAEDEKQSAMLTELVGAIVGGVAAGAASTVKAAVRPPNYTDAHLTRIGNSLDDIKKRL